MAFNWMRLGGMGIISQFCPHGPVTACFVFGGIVFVYLVSPAVNSKKPA